MSEVFITVGTNPVPVLAAAYRLTQHFCEEDGKVPKLVFLHSRETEPDARVIVKVLTNRFVTEGLQVDCIPLNAGDAGNPAEIVRCVSSFLSGSPSTSRHLHYSGGRKSMGVKAMQALVPATSKAKFTDSYLDIDSHTLVSDRGRLTQISDERQEWNLDLRQLLELHRYTLDFSLGNRATFGKSQRPAVPHYENPDCPDDAWASLGTQIMDVLAAPAHGDVWRQWTGKEPLEKLSGRWPSQLNPKEPLSGPIQWPGGIADSRWTAIPEHINQLLQKECWSGPELTLFPAVLTPDELRRLVKLLANGWLELAAYDCFRRALLARKPSFNIYSSFHAAALAANPNHAVTRDFEIDLLAILGYQAIVVSCTISSRVKEIKLKGFEALHRARQLGGSGSRAIVLSGLTASDSQLLQDELYHETGVAGRPLCIWPRDCWYNLKGKFETYIDSIDWR